MEKDYFSVTDLMDSLKDSFGEGNVGIKYERPNAGLPKTKYGLPAGNLEITAYNLTIGYGEGEYPVYRAHIDLKIPANNIGPEQIAKYKSEGINVKSNGKCTRLRITVDTETQKSDSPNTITKENFEKALDAISQINKTY